MTKSVRDFQVFAKPIGPLCNLACRYCYYSNLRTSPANTDSIRMPDPVLEAYVRRHIEASAGDTVSFSWHGGEPTLLGLDYFRRIVALQRRHLPRDKRLFNGMQTNGLLIDEDWCRFLSSEGFGVGLSMDGPPDLHDCYRVTREGEPTHSRVLRAFQLLKRSGIVCDILCAVHDQNVRYPLRVYNYFKEIGVRSIGFLPIVERLPGSISEATSYSTPAAAFGDFLCAIFEEWIRQDIGRITVQIFEEAARSLQGADPSLCVFRKTCGTIPAVERNGDFFPCDHFADANHRIGNILETPLSRLLESPRQRAFGAAKRNSLPRHCLLCDVLDMCNGGCPKDRFLTAPDGEPGLNYLCAGYRQFFTRSRGFFLKVIALSRARRGSNRPPGRNEACPCGSGLKYKKCCMNKKSAENSP